MFLRTFAFQLQRIACHLTTVSSHGDKALVAQFCTSSGIMAAAQHLSPARAAHLLYPPVDCFRKQHHHVILSSCRAAPSWRGSRGCAPGGLLKGRRQRHQRHLQSTSRFEQAVGFKGESLAVRVHGRATTATPCRHPAYPIPDLVAPRPPPAAWCTPASQSARHPCR